MKGDKQLFLKIHNRDEVIFEGSVASLSSINDKGKFDILQKHVNFITLVRDKLELVMPDGNRREVPIQDGILKVENDKIDVFLGVNF